MSKTLQNAIKDDGLISNVKKAFEKKEANFAYSVGDPIPLIDTTSGNVTMTLPAITKWDNEAYRHEIELAHVKGGNDVIVSLSGTEKFAWGNSYFNLGSALKGFTIAAIRYGTMQSYGILRNIIISAASKRSATWAASNFSSMTVVPMDSEMYNNQTQLLVYTGGATSSYKVLAAGDYYVTYRVSIDSTGGSRWNIVSELFKNGTTLGEDYRMRGGNYTNEDDSLSLSRTKLTLAADDVIDLRLNQSGLTGNVVNAVLTIEITL